jgi:serine/threonine-protein kinase
MTAADTVKDLHVQVKRCPECGSGFGAEAAFCPFDGGALRLGTWDPTRDPLTDTVIDNRYEVIEPLGEGGMGTVYKVRHTTLDRMFAMKVLRRDLAADPGLAARFLQEARATAAIRHPSVVAINDFGELDDGAPYFVMELLVGETLATRMRARGLLTPREAAGIARKLADALSAAHAAGVVHRDLKPENVFLVGASLGKAAADDIRIVDFGAAKVIGASKLTRPGVVFGTPYYMSPEQASGQSVDARADVYSLGVLLYEMITGGVPFEADTYMGVLTKHMFASPAKPSERTPSGVQLGELEAVVLRALEKEASARFPSMEEMAAALERAVAARASESPRDESRSAPIAYTGGLSTADKIQRSVTRQLEEEQRRKRRTVVIAAVSAAATLVMCALAVSVIDDSSGSKLASPREARVAVPPSAAVAPTTLPPNAIPAPEPAITTAVAVATGAPSVTASASGAEPAASAVTVTTAPASTVPPPSAAAARTATARPRAAEGASPRPPTTPARPTSQPSLVKPDDLPDPWHR